MTRPITHTIDQADEETGDIYVRSADSGRVACRTEECRVFERRYNNAEHSE